MPDRFRRALVPLAVALVAGLVLLLTLLGGGGDEEKSPAAGSGAADRPAAGGSEEQGPGVPRLDPQDPLARGDVDAPVVLIAYSEFQCPFCGKWSRDTAPELQDYIDDGTLRIEWRDFPYLGDESVLAAYGARAAAAQDSFWEFHDAVYADQPSPNSGTIDEEFLVDLAEKIGLDGKRFRRDFGSQEVRSAVDADRQEGYDLGVTGTPSFLINDVPIVGAQPTKVFRQTIESQAEELQAK